MEISLFFPQAEKNQEINSQLDLRENLNRIPKVDSTFQAKKFLGLVKTTTLFLYIS